MLAFLRLCTHFLMIICGVFEYYQKCFLYRPSNSVCFTWHITYLSGFPSRMLCRVLWSYSKWSCLTECWTCLSSNKSGCEGQKDKTTGGPATPVNTEYGKTGIKNIHTQKLSIFQDTWNPPGSQNFLRKFTTRPSSTPLS